MRHSHIAMGYSDTCSRFTFVFNELYRAIKCFNYFKLWIFKDSIVSFFLQGQEQYS